ncbi:hypothetical protein BGX28_006597 [Mortierella sp. GBA30]|nr:hypothetical protein BGX28_006597 [Mortierella sp. GBA30]
MVLDYITSRKLTLNDFLELANASVVKENNALHDTENLEKYLSRKFGLDRRQSKSAQRESATKLAFIRTRFYGLKQLWVKSLNHKTQVKRYEIKMNHATFPPTIEGCECPDFLRRLLSASIFMRLYQFPNIRMPDNNNFHGHPAAVAQQHVWFRTWVLQMLFGPKMRIKPITVRRFKTFKKLKTTMRDKKRH